MNEQDRAEEHLRTIRRLMERATIYRAISAPTALVGGLLSLAACGVYLRAGSLRDHCTYLFLEVWLVVLLATVLANTLFICIGARKRGEPIFSSSMKAALIALLPALIAGGAFTYHIAGTDWNSGRDFMMSAAWALFYGAGLLATSHFAPRSLTLLGWAFLLCGVVGVMLVNPIGKVEYGAFYQTFAVLFMGLTFGLFHLIYAACAWTGRQRNPEL